MSRLPYAVKDGGACPSNGKLIKRSFAGKHIQTRLTNAPGANEKVTESDLPTPVFDFNGGMYGLLLAAQPLQVGYSAIMPAVGEFSDDYVRIPFKVIRREAINAGFKGRTNAWVVQVGGDSPMTFWISDRPPYILRLVLPMSGGEARFEMIR